MPRPRQKNPNAEKTVQNAPGRAVGRRVGKPTPEALSVVLAGSETPRIEDMPSELIPYADLKPHPKNPKYHGPEQIMHLIASIKEHGVYKNIVCARDGTILAGHGVWLALGRLNAPACRVVRLDIDPYAPAAIKLMAADNEIGQLAEVNNQLLIEALKVAHEGTPGGLLGTGYNEFMLNSLVAVGRKHEPKASEGGGVSEGPAPKIDKSVELHKKWGVEPGDVWVIKSATGEGYHVVMCGECDKATDIDKLMDGTKAQGVITSPPYAEQRKGKYGGVHPEKYVDWWEVVQASVRRVLAPDGSFFVNIKPHVEDGERSLYVFDLVLAMKRRYGWRYVEELIWNNTGTPGSFVDRFKNQFEPVYQFTLSRDTKFRPDNVKHYTDEAFQNDVSVDVTERQGTAGMSVCKNSEGRHPGFALPGNVLRVPSHNHGGKGSGHPAVFPVGLPAFFIKAYSDEGDTWLDPFCGSGTIIVAAEQCKRLARGMERNPAYVAVTLERLSESGLKPERFNE